MGQITGAIVGITLVLMSVFVPMAFFPGSVGIIYRQFSVTMIAAIGFSALMALSLTPALCATMLKPVEGRSSSRDARPVRLVQPPHGAGEGRLRGMGPLVDPAHRPPHADLSRHAARGVGWAFVRLPGGFLPVDDQGFITTDVQTPPEASFPRTLDAVKRVEDYLLKRAGIDTVTFLTGFSFLGQGQNTAQAFITLKDWSERPATIPPSGSSPTSTAASRRSATPRSPRCSRRRSTISAIRAASASACRIAASAATPN